MQATSKELYKNVASSSGKDLSLIKSVGDAVFYKLFLFFRNPDSLICKLKGVGFWYMRKKNLNDYVKKHANYYSKEEERIFKDERDARDYERNKIQYFTLVDRQIQYASYLAKKAEIRLIRNKTQPLQKPKPDEEC